MAFSVYHVGLGIDLNLTLPDLGHPDLPGLWEMLRADDRPVPERQLQCIQCRKLRPQCPEWMFLTERDGKRFASHFTRGIADHDTVNESDEHKAYKERIVRAAEQGGLACVVEDRSVDGKRRTDVVVNGAEGVSIGWEVQLSYATLDSVRKRSALARQAGITPLWASVDSTRDFIDRVPWALLPDVPSYVIQKAQGLQVRGGVRNLEFFRCARGHTVGSAFCPVKGSGYCGKLHGTWQSAHGVTLDDLVQASALGEYVPIIIPGKRVRRWWVRPDDRDRYIDSVGALPTEVDLLAGRRKTDLDLQPTPLEITCRYGEDTGFRSAPSPIRDDGSPVVAPATFNDLPPAPTIHQPRPHVCGALADRTDRTKHCGKPARLYACGWRCDAHKPKPRSS